MVQSALERLNAALRGHKTPFRVTTGGRESKAVRFDAPADAMFTMPSGEVVSGTALLAWEIPREAPEDWPEATRQPLADFWDARLARQKAIDASIAAKAEFEFLYESHSVAISPSISQWRAFMLPILKPSPGVRLTISTLKLTIQPR